MKATSFSDAIAAALHSAGFGKVVLVRASSQDNAFGNSEAVFLVEDLLLRFVRDRGQEFVDLASPRTPEHFHQFHDVEAALGWTTIDQILAKQSPDALNDVLSRVKKHLNELKDAFSAEREDITQNRLRQTTQERGQAFIRKLAQAPR